MQMDMTRTECKLAWQGRAANGNCKDGLKAQWLPQPRANALGKRIQNRPTRPIRATVKTREYYSCPYRARCHN